MHAILTDVRFAARVLARSPGSLAVAVVTLALATCRRRVTRVSPPTALRTE